MKNYDKEIEEYLKKSIPIMKSNLDKHKETNENYEKQCQELIEIEKMLKSSDDSKKVK